MANRQRRLKRFGLAGGRHRIKRKALASGSGKKSYRYSSCLKDSSSCVLTISRKMITGKKKPKVVKRRGLKKFYQLYRSAETGQLRKRFVKRLFKGEPNGYRLINLNNLQDHVSELSMHAATCKKASELALQGQSPIILNSEIDNYGLASVLCAICKGCHREIIMKTSPVLNISKQSRHFDVNVRAVWGTIATGNGQSHLNELLGTTDSPGMNQRTFNKIENDINGWWNEVLQNDLRQAVEEEKELAIANGCFHEGVPSISVICDGGWSKRTHKHSYNAMGGVGVIIGAKTKKLLHIGIRNKYCYVCQHAESVGCKPKEHQCFKNWDSSSQAMEADIIVEGFLKANEYGVRYMTIIADGDSSTYARIQEEVPVWGRHVKKGECANHVCKCLRGNLEKLVDGNPSYKGKGNLTKAVRVRITSAVRCAIRMRSAEKDQKKAAKLLEKDIKNSVNHVFGDHTNCSLDFCKKRDTTSKDEHETENKIENETSYIDNLDDDIFQDQVKFWNEGASIREQEDSRKASNYSCSNPKLIKDVSIILNRVAAKSDRLLGNYTTNLAESWMHMRTKFDGGKVFNHCSRGSWHTRCFAGGLRCNEGPKWSPLVWEKCTETQPGQHFNDVYEQRNEKLIVGNRNKSKPENKVKRWKRKMKSVSESQTKKARLEYGNQARDVEPDVSTEELNKLINKFKEEQIDITGKKMLEIEENTKEQSNSKLWKLERKKRLTTSNFGCVFKRKVSLKVAPLVRTILHSKFKGTKWTEIGLENESAAVKEYLELKTELNEKLTFEKMGLVISKKCPFLAGSPDGKLTDINGKSGLIEIKNVLYNKPVSLTQAASLKTTKNFCLEIDKETKKLKLKKNHNYYFQCLGLLHITEFEWIDFVVRTENPYELHVERISPNVSLWNKILPKLKAFYHKVLLPEIVLPRHGKTPGIREPGLWLENDSKLKKQSTEKRSNPTQSKTSNSTKLPIPSTSNQPDPIPGTSSQVSPEISEADTIDTRRSRRHQKIKFVGRRISHLWQESESDDKSQWYRGTVLSVIRGTDGNDDALYEVQYDGDPEVYELDNLLGDLRDSQLKFIDI